MGVRTKTTLAVEVGQNNSLDDCLFERSFEALLDTLEHASTQTLTLPSATTNQAVNLGDVSQARLLYIESNVEIEVSFGGGAATAAAVTGSGGSYPTSFVGTETLVLEVDQGGLVTVAFDAADQSLAQVINRINAAVALNGQGLIASDASGELKLTSPTTGAASEIDISGGTAAATLGLSATTVSGSNPNPNTSNLRLQRPADPSGASAAAGVSAYLLATVNTDAIYLTNLSTTLDATVTVMVAGGLIASS